MLHVIACEMNFSIENQFIAVITINDRLDDRWNFQHKLKVTRSVQDQRSVNEDHENHHGKLSRVAFSWRHGRVSEAAGRLSQPPLSYLDLLLITSINCVNRKLS